ncbi:hypothetical protein [Rhodoplanes sp. Z2-YC6860]|uniref:hypothetical protein n=1 Tax=Rhodoplanes sp. Z2-YC6860 TaxID=674703 RepID=UPI00078D1F64|nr:hypothetical protein [Rhodoplanes sp. Z2-YC6860]AMN42185.1 hypothetical protein RHPLAN_37530 [Rhodoplanes sp. Z2-YC6860]
MRTALLPVLVVFGGVLAEDAKAQTFCAVNSQGATNCSFTSITACRDEVRGDGGFCLPQAPIGHRQPRAADVTGSGDDTINPRQDQRNRRLDRSLQLCRGC